MSPVPALPRKTIHLPTNATYNLWAPTYDTDGNILQALDSYGLKTKLLPQLITLLSANINETSDSTYINANQKTIFITDLGCGTGRASIGLISALRSSISDLKRLQNAGYACIDLLGLDFSAEMLKLAAGKIESRIVLWNCEDHENALYVETTLKAFDIFHSVATSSPRAAHAVISTLVLEHIPLNIYFRQVTRLLRAGGLLLLTNMHEDMGNARFDSVESADTQQRIPTGAGFVDAASDTKVRGTSFAHEIADVVDAARAVGLALVEGGLHESTVEKWMLEETEDSGEALLGSRGRKWVGIRCWWGMIFQYEERS